MPRLFADLHAAWGDGTYPRMLDNLSKKHLLVLDDWGLAPFTDEKRRDLLEIVEDRHDGCSTVIASQFPTSIGTRRSATPPSPTPSSIASCTKPTRSC